MAGVKGMQRNKKPLSPEELARLRKLVNFDPERDLDKRSKEYEEHVLRREG